MKRFTFFLTILLIIIGMLSWGLIKNKTGNSNIEEGYVISQAKTQKLWLSQSDKNVFTLKGQISDGTHNQIIVRVADTAVIDEFTQHITTEPFELNINMPENKSEAFINIYYKDDTELVVCLNAVKAINDNGNWHISQNINTEANSQILNNISENQYVYSDSELKEIPQGILTLSDTITKAHSMDYDKAYALYMWLCEHMYMTEKLEDNSLENIFNTRIVDNESYAKYFAVMLRAQNIPCAIVECENGYFFNRVYVNGDWINVQPDRDTFNKYQSHRYIYNRKNVFTHFGTPTDIISANYVIKSVIK